MCACFSISRSSCSLACLFTHAILCWPPHLSTFFAHFGGFGPPVHASYSVLITQRAILTSAVALELRFSLSSFALLKASEWSPPTAPLKPSTALPLNFGRYTGAAQMGLKSLKRAFSLASELTALSSSLPCQWAWSPARL